MGVKIIDLPDLTGLPENGDYVAITDGTVTAKLNYQLLAQAIIEEYASSSLGGTNQALKTVIDSLSTDVTALNDLHTLSYETFEITAGAATVTTFHNSVEKYGKIAILRLNFTCSTDINQRLVVATLPEGYRPNREYVANFDSNLSIAGGGSNNYIILRENGEIALNPRTGVRVVVPFFVADPVEPEPEEPEDEDPYGDNE